MKVFSSKQGRKGKSCNAWTDGIDIIDASGGWCIKEGACHMPGGRYYSGAIQGENMAQGQRMSLTYQNKQQTLALVHE
jgi:hypothetical protein